MVPAVNQVESHPAFWRPELDALCRELGVVVEAYSPLGRGSDIESEPARAAAAAHGVTCAQAVLRWHIQKGHVIIPKSTHAERMRENLDVFGFALTIPRWRPSMRSTARRARLAAIPTHSTARRRSRT